MNYFKNIINKRILTLAVTSFFGVSFSASAGAETVYIKSLNADGKERGLCVQKSSSNLRLRKCKDKKSQKFERIVSVSDRINGDKIRLKQGDRCILMKFQNTIEKTRQNVRSNAKVRLGVCDNFTTGGSSFVLKNTKSPIWSQNKDNTLSPFVGLGDFQICISDEDKGDKLRATFCDNNPGLWKIEAVN